MSMIPTVVSTDTNMAKQPKRAAEDETGVLYKSLLQQSSDEIENLKKKLAKQRSDVLQNENLKEKVFTQKNDIAQLASQKDALTQKYAELEWQYNLFKKLVDEISNSFQFDAPLAHVDTASLKNHLDAILQYIQSTTTGDFTQIPIFLKQFNDLVDIFKKALHDQFMLLSTQITTLENNINVQNDEIKTLDALHKQYMLSESELKAAKEALEMRIAAMETQIDSIQQSDTETIQGLRADAVLSDASHASTLATLRAELDTLRSQLTMNHQELSTKQEEITNLNNRIVQLTDAASMNHQQDQTMIESLQKELEDAKAAVTRKRAAADEQERQESSSNKKMKEDLEERVRELTDQLVKLQGTQQENVQLHNTASDMQSRIEVLQKELEAAKKKRTAVEEQERQESNSSKKMKSDLEEKEKYVEKLADELAQLQRENLDLQRDVGQARSATMTMQDDLRKKFIHFKYTMPAGYTITPAVTDDTATISSLTIENEHGKIEFLDPINLRENAYPLLSIVHIVEGKAEVYPDTLFFDIKPASGHGFNRRARITLYHIRPKFNKTEEQFKELLRVQKHMRFVSYENHNWVFTVPHFTIYGLDALTDEEDRPVVNAASSAVSRLEAEQQRLDQEAPNAARQPAAYAQQAFSHLNETRRAQRNLNVRRAGDIREVQQVAVRTFVGQLGIAEKLSLTQELFFGNENKIDPKANKTKLKDYFVLHDIKDDMPLFMRAHMLVPDVFADPRVPVWLPRELVQIRAIIEWVNNNRFRTSAYLPQLIYREHEYRGNLFFFNATVLALFLMHYLNDAFFAHDEAGEMDAMFGFYWRFYKEYLTKVLSETNVAVNEANQIQHLTVTVLLDILKRFHDIWMADEIEL